MSYVIRGEEGRDDIDIMEARKDVIYIWRLSERRTLRRMTYPYRSTFTYPYRKKVDGLVIIYYSNVFSTLIMYHQNQTNIGPYVFSQLVFIYTKSAIYRVGHLE